MRTRLVTNSVCGRVFLAVIIIACLVIWGCVFGFLVIVGVKGVLFFILDCIFWLMRCFCILVYLSVRHL